MTSPFEWPPRRRRKKLAVAFPASVLATEDTLELKTIKAGIIGRILAVYRVDQAVIFMDPESREGDLKLLKLLLEYMVSPPHLRRKLYPITRELSAAALLPPLRIYSHDIPEDLSPGVKLDVLIESCRGFECRAYMGRWGYSVIRGSFKPGDVVTAVVESVGGDVVLSPSTWGDAYTGFKVKVRREVEPLIESFRVKGYLIVLASKYGNWIYEARDGVKSRLSTSKGLLVLFGGPYRCLYEYTDGKLYDFIVNTIPLQGALTVRTEEAMIATLSALDNVLEYFKM